MTEFQRKKDISKLEKGVKTRERERPGLTLALFVHKCVQNLFQSSSESPTFLHSLHTKVTLHISLTLDQDKISSNKKSTDSISIKYNS